MDTPEKKGCLEDLIKDSMSELNLDVSSLPDIFHINISHQSSQGLRNKLMEGDNDMEQLQKVRIAINSLESDLPLELIVNSSIVFPCPECKCSQSDEFLSAEEDLPFDMFPRTQFKIASLLDQGKGDCIDYMPSESYHKYKHPQVPFTDYHRSFNPVYGTYPLSSQLKDDFTLEPKSHWSDNDFKLKTVGIQTDVVLGADSFSQSTSHVSMNEQNSFIQPTCSKQDSVLQMYNIKRTNCESTASVNFTFDTVDNLTGLILKTQTNLINLQNLKTFNNFNILKWWKKFHEIHSVDESKDIISFLNILYQSYLSPVNFFLSLNGVYHDMTEGALEDHRNKIKSTFSGEPLKTSQLISKFSSLQKQLASLSNEPKSIRQQKNSNSFEHKYNYIDSSESYHNMPNNRQTITNSAVDYSSPRTRCIREELNNFIARCLNEESNNEVQNKLRPEIPERKRGFSYRLCAINGSQSLRYLKSAGSLRQASNPPIWSEPNDLIK